MKRTLIILILSSLVLLGCSQTLQETENDSGSIEAATPTPSLTPTETPTPTPEPTEVPEDEDTGDAFVDFTRKVAGVWGTDDELFYSFEGDVLKRGWWESDALPDATIAEVKQLDKNKYEVFVKDQSLVDEDGGFFYEGQDFTAVFDGTRDGFKETFILSSEGGEALFARMGDDFEEAMQYEFSGGFTDDFKKLKVEIMGDKAGDYSGVAGVWLTEGYDVNENWAVSYKIELSDDGKATCEGWRNKDTGTYEMTGDDKVLITFDKCETDSPGEGWVPVEGFKYTVEMIINGDDARIKDNAPDVISNLVDGSVHRK